MQSKVINLCQKSALILSVFLILNMAFASIAKSADYWTAYVSEEDSPAYCSDGYLVGSADCSGEYCDNISLFCDQDGEYNSHGQSYWTQPFSEEEGTGFCKFGYFITGISCSGNYCDNISIECSDIGDWSNCYWTGSHSEENDLGHFSAGYFAVGVKCSGDYCDNKSYYVCKP
ncbi:MAG: hypothetical protein GY874_15260 [Desulfobacteraceae bacterium]|nr:hypothetical protein [Desulfobacteraceae bacterium]